MRRLTFFALDAPIAESFCAHERLYGRLNRDCAEFYRAPAKCKMNLLGGTLRYLFVLLALAGIIVSSLALREHYRTEGIAPCSINDKWDCGAVNKSDYAMLFGKIPVAGIGIAGYLLLAILGGLRWYRILLLATLPAMAFSLYLTHVEAHILEIWCIYCVISLALISTITLLAIGTVSVNFFKDRAAQHGS